MSIYKDYLTRGNHFNPAYLAGLGARVQTRYGLTPRTEFKTANPHILFNSTPVTNIKMVKYGGRVTKIKLKDISQ